jgi:hypothetical protein
LFRLRSSASRQASRAKVRAIDIENRLSAATCILTEHVIAQNDALLPPCGADAEAILVKIGKAHHTPRITVHDRDEIGQRASDLRSVQSKSWRPTRHLTNPLNASIAVGRHLGAEIAQAAGERLACGDHMCAA